MAVCAYCGKEAKFLYICPQCHKKYCKEHKKPETHECSSVKAKISTDKMQTEQEEFLAQDLLEEPILSTSVDENEPTRDEEQTTPIISEKQQSQENLKVQSLAAGFFESLEIDPLVNGVKKQASKLKPTWTLPHLPKIDIRRTLVLTLFLIITISSIGLNGLLYIQYDTYRDAYTGTQDEMTQAQIVRGYYDELLSRNSELLTEYDRLNELYSNLMQNNVELKQEYNDIMSYNHNINLVTEKTVTIPPKGNITELYSIPFCGYVTINYTASGEAYTWIGSTNLPAVYFSRNPQFPETATNCNFTIPVLPDIMFYVANPDETQSITVTFTIDFTY